MPATTAPSEREEPEVERVRDQREAEEQVRAEVDEEDLHDHRRAAEDQHVDAREEPERREARHPHERRDQPEHHAEDLREHGDVDRRPERAREDVVRVEDPVPDDVPVDRRRASSAPPRRLLLEQDDCASSPTWRGSSSSSRRRTSRRPPSASPASSGSPLRIAMPTGIGLIGVPPTRTTLSLLRCSTRRRRRVAEVGVDLARPSARRPRPCPSGRSRS